jgi:hypothetical protein
LPAGEWQLNLGEFSTASLTEKRGMGRLGAVAKTCA